MFSYKRIYLALILLLIGSEVLSQAFSKSWSIGLPPAYESVKAEWGDLDNDGLLDIVILVRENGNNHISIIKGDTANIPAENDALKFSVIDSDRFYLIDFNSDNMLDIVVPDMDASMPVTVYLNNRDMIFGAAVTTIPSFSKMAFADIDNDAAPEWIISHMVGGENRLTTFKNTENVWEPVDTLMINADALEVFDADGDGFRDIFVSGQATPDSLFTGFLLNQGHFKFTVSNRIDAKGTASAGDVNHDGFFDVVLKGTDQGGSPVNKIYLSNGGGYSVRDTLFDSFTPNVFIADFNSDGAADINYWSKIPSGDSLSLIKNGPLTYDTLSLHQVLSEKFGDVEHDGDLDVLQIQQDDSLTLVLFNNNAQPNFSPAIPFQVWAFTFFDHSFMTWVPSVDDHTPTPALTYDIFLGGVNPGDFDVLNEMRLKVNHGNNSSRTFLLIDTPPVSTLQFALQPVDNSFHGGYPDVNGPPGICVGVFQMCASMELDSVTMCSKEKRTFTGPGNASWYSFSSGFLSSGAQLEYTASSSDVVFFFSPTNPDCAGLQAWYIEVKDTTRVESVSLYKCEGEQIHLEAEPQWTSIHWKSLKDGSLGTSGSIDYEVTVDDRVNVLLSMGTGCSVDREFIINVSKPEVSITAENTFVLAGKSVQLHATGAERYTWNSGSSIDDVNSSDPFVNPLETTNYIVTGYDSVDCQDQATITINVEKNGFIPSLFTPNNDGSNDVLRVYGIFEAEEVSFEIFNRSGNRVYSASSIQEITRGWDGTAHGIKQPGGVYFWKVKGKLFSGENIQFNGKETGSIVLIR